MSNDRIFAKCAWRLIPFVIAGYVVNYLDRTNIGFAALAMNEDLGFPPSVYGLGAGVFFLSYSLFQVPANLMLHRLGARRWIFAILACWGAASSASSLIRDQPSFYALRFLLGVTEAGFFPGVIFYLSFWFPKAWLGRMTAAFMSATAVSIALGGPLASLILSLDGTASIRGWQWLFLLEGLPACVLGIAILRFLPDGPTEASWLTESERATVASHLCAEDCTKDQDLLRALCDPRVILVGIAGGALLLAIYGFGFWLPLIVQSLGFSNTATGFVTGLLYLLVVPSMIFWARSSDRNDDRIWHIAFASIFSATALMLASIAHNNFLLLAALGAAAIGMYSALPIMNTIGPMFLKGRALAGGFALFNMIANFLGGFAGQYAIGMVRERTGGYAAVLAVMSAGLVLSALIAVFVGRSIARGTPMSTNANPAT